MVVHIFIVEDGSLSNSECLPIYLLCNMFGTGRFCISLIPVNTYLSKVNNRNTRKRSEICSKLTMKTPERSLTSFWCFYL